MQQHRALVLTDIVGPAVQADIRTIVASALNDAYWGCRTYTRTISPNALRSDIQDRWTLGNFGLVFHLHKEEGNTDAICDGPNVFVPWEDLELTTLGRVMASLGGQTRIHIKVSGCEGCKLNAYSSPSAIEGIELIMQSSAPPAYNWTGPWLTVRNGRAEFSIPTKLTEGMALSISAAWGNAGPAAAPLVALSAPGVYGAAGSGHVFERCWQGTSNATATLNIRVVRLRAEKTNGAGAPIGKWGVWPHAFLSTLRQPKAMLATQEAPWCPVEL